MSSLRIHQAGAAAARSPRSVWPRASGLSPPRRSSWSRMVRGIATRSFSARSGASRMSSVHRLALRIARLADVGTDALCRSAARSRPHLESSQIQLQVDVGTAASPCRARRRRCRCGPERPPSRSIQTSATSRSAWQLGGLGVGAEEGQVGAHLVFDHVVVGQSSGAGARSPSTCSAARRLAGPYSRPSSTIRPGGGGGQLGGQVGCHGGHRREGVAGRGSRREDGLRAPPPPPCGPTDGATRARARTREPGRFSKRLGAGSITASRAAW